MDPVVFLFKDQEPILSKRGAPLPEWCFSDFGLARCLARILRKWMSRLAGFAGLDPFHLYRIHSEVPGSGAAAFDGRRLGHKCGRHMDMIPTQQQLMADLLKSLSHSQQQLAVQEAGHCSSEHSQRNGDLSPHADGHDVPEIDAAGRMLGHMAERATSVAVDASPAFDASVHGRWLYNASDPGDVADTDYFDPNGTCLHDASWI